MAYKQKSTVKSLCSGSMAKMNADLEYDPINDDADSPVPMYGSKKPALPNLKSGGKMISSDKGSSNYMKEDPAAYMTGSPAKHSMGGTSGREVKHSHNDTNSSSGKKGFFGQDSGTGIYGPNSFFETYRSKQQREAKAKGSSGKGGNTSVNKDTVGPKNSGQSSTNKPAPEVFKGDFSDPNKTSAGPAPAVKPRKKVETVGRPGKVSGTTVRKTGGGMTGTKVKVSPEIKTSGKTTEGIKDVKAKKASEPKEMSRKQIREDKKKDKDSGMSRKEVRLNKTKRKAASTRAKTVSKETAAKGGKEAQRLARKTIRLEKRAARLEGKVKASKIK